jgi:hypothetical protein
MTWHVLARPTCHAAVDVEQHTILRDVLKYLLERLNNDRS